jgi:hypothetical protein
LRHQFFKSEIGSEVSPGMRLFGPRPKSRGARLCSTEARIIGERHRPGIIDRQSASLSPDM